MEPRENGDMELSARLPFTLITPPHPDLLNSTFGERYEGLSGTVLIHPDDARLHSINDGEKVKIINHRGWSSVQVPRTGTTIRVINTSTQDNFMQVLVNP